MSRLFPKGRKPFKWDYRIRYCEYCGERSDKKYAVKDNYGWFCSNHCRILYKFKNGEKRNVEKL
jgi:NADH pyrophosphatase NudC (nudix superfamily)